MNNDKTSVLLVAILTIVVIAFFSMMLSKSSAPTAVTSTPTLPPVNPTPPIIVNPPVIDVAALIKKDFDDAAQANANIFCIQTLTSGIAPYDNKTYQVASPCDLDWLVTNRNWKKVS